MAVAINPNARETYVLEEDRALPETERTEWLLRPVTAGDFAEIGRKSAGEFFLADLGFAGLCGWNNFRDTDGRQVVYSPEAARTRVAVRWIREIAVAVAALSRIREPDEKNSESPQPSSAEK